MIYQNGEMAHVFILLSCRLSCFVDQLVNSCLRGFSLTLAEPCNYCIVSLPNECGDLGDLD